MTRVLELFGLSTTGKRVAWEKVVAGQQCPFVDRKCYKVRKSRPDVSIGTCSVAHGRKLDPVAICPLRLLERRQVFTDCLHLLLTSHEPGNELHIVNEINIPGGSVDYFLASTRSAKVRDFVGVELQTMDTTGTVWPERQRFLQSKGLRVTRADIQSSRPFGMNWKMTAKTVLVQLHHKIQTFEHINKRLVLAIQDRLLSYMQSQFRFGHLTNARLGDPMQIHAYSLGLNPDRSAYVLSLSERLSTDSAGIAACLGLQAEAKVDLEDVVRQIEAKLSNDSLLTFEAPPSPGATLP